MKRPHINFIAIALLHSAVVTACLLVLLVSLISCRSHRQTATERVHRSTTEQLNHSTTQLSDSTYRRDSIFVSQYQAGDTVYLTRLVTRYYYRDRLHRDTILISLTDTVRETLSVTTGKQPTHTKATNRTSRLALIPLTILLTLFIVACLAVYKKVKL